MRETGSVYLNQARKKENVLAVQNLDHENGQHYEQNTWTRWLKWTEELICQPHYQQWLSPVAAADEYDF